MSLTSISKGKQSNDFKRAQYNKYITVVIPCVFIFLWLKQLFFFSKFYDFFCMRRFLMNRPCYNNLFQFKQLNNFQNLNRVIFTHWKHLESRINVFWYCFPVIKRYTFHYLMKSAPIPRNQSSLEILWLLDIWRYQSLVILFFNSVVILLLLTI